MARKLIRAAGRAAGPKGSWRRRCSILLSLIIAVGAAMIVNQNVMAVHDGTPFELDTPPGSPTPPGGPGANVTTSNNLAKDDWDEICFAVTNDPGCGTDGALSATVTATMWSADCPAGFVPPQGGSVLDCGDFDLVPAAKDASVFTGGGSKDPEPIENWLWKNMAVPQKNNLVHAFAARYSVTSSPQCPGPGGENQGATKCDVLYFGSDRWDNDGSAQQGFWFLQDKIGLDGAPGGGATHFTGSHKPDDVLVLSDFTQGGVISTITVYKWDNPRINPAFNPALPPSAANPQFIGCAATGNAVDPTNIKKSVNDGTCGAANLRRLTPAGGAANCYGATADPFCGVVNEVNSLNEPPWTFRDAEDSVTYRTNELLEAGVNLSAFPGLSGKCFASIVAESRASGSSFTATNQDFVLGSFGECTSGMVTTPVLPQGGVFPGSSVRDSVTQLDITGIQSWSGLIKFFICSPTQLDAPPVQGQPDDDPNTCDVGGVQVGSDIGVKGNPIDPPLPILSALFQIPVAGPAGTWCFRGEFDSLTQDLPDASDSSTGECFTVDLIQPSLSTSQTWEVKDSATITATAGGNLTGNLVFQLWNAAGCAGTKLYDSGNIPVSGASPQSKSTDDAVSPTGSLVFTTTNIGQLSWRVTYASTNAAQKGVIHSCGGENSTLTVNNGSTSTTPFP